MAWTVALLLSLTVAGWAQAQRCLVLPFPNRSGDPSLDWLGESFVVGLRTAMARSSVTVLSHDERARALALLGVPAGAELSLASQMRLAKAADARWLVVGWYDYDGETLTAGASLVDLEREHLTALAAQSGPLTELESMQARLGWAVQNEVEPGAPAAAPGAAAVSMPLSAYEEFTRARLAATPAERIQRLLTAAHLAPQSGRVLLALGEAYAANHQTAPALEWLEKVPPSAPERLEAAFQAGVAAYTLGQTQKAADLWRSVAQQLPLPAVMNNLAVAEKILAAGPSHPEPEGQIETAFPADEYHQLARAVGEYAAQKSETVPPEARAAYEVQAGDKLRAQGALTAAADAYQRALAACQPGQDQQRAAAHVGLASIAYARQDLALAGREVAAALAAAPDSAAAKALQAKLGSGHEHP